MLAVQTLLVILLFKLRVFRSSIIPIIPHNKAEKTSAGSSPRSNDVHNITVDCGDKSVLEKTAWHCLWDLHQMGQYGYPWLHREPQRNSRNNPKITDRNNSVRDALDTLNQVCHIYDRSQACLEESGIRDYCLTTTVFIKFKMDFQFTCHHQRRDENLVHSLRCLRDTRVMVMLYFHIAKRCRGVGILDDVMKRYKNAYFYKLDIKPVLMQPAVLTLYCLPKSVICNCVKYIVEDHCGTLAADLVQNYLIYLQDRFGEAFESAGLDSNICDSDISSGVVPSTCSRRPVPLGHTKFDIDGLLKITAPGTALDTVGGKALMAYVSGLSGEEICTTSNAYIAYSVCVMSSDDRSEKNKFNIVQFSHQITVLLYHGTQCNRLESFTSCWNLLQEICGPKVRGLEQHATLLTEGCKIQSEMDTVGCHWQDMLLEHYIQAGAVTVWPITVQCLVNPMSLDDPHYTSFNSLIADLDTVISLLQPGVEEISSQCGSQSADRLRILLQKLRYLQRYAMTYSALLGDIVIPN